MPRRRLLLICPRDTAVTYGDMRYVAHITRRPGGVLNAALATVAAMTPREHWDVTLVDEHLTPIDFDGPWDLVGLTGFPTQLQRARAIAREFRKRGVLVVAGGSSVSVSPERWRPFCDVLFVGLAERTWPRFLRDYEGGSWDDAYVEPEKLGFADTPVPDYSGFAQSTLDQYQIGVVQTSRGCPFRCEFCDAIVYLGRKMRYKPIDRIVAELETLADMGLEFVYLADDNFTANRRKAKEILGAFREFNQGRKRPLQFYATVSIDTANDEELVRMAAEANMLRVLVGLETPNEESLRASAKLQNVHNDMATLVERLHHYGIQVMTGSVVGFDQDGLDIFERQVQFFTELGIPNVLVFPLQAPDGTPLQQRIEAEGRYLDWDKALDDDSFRMNNFNTFTIVPRQMTVEQLQQGTYWMVWKLYQHEAIAERFRVMLDHYEASPVRDQLSLPKLGMGRRNLGILARLARHLATRSSRDERRALARIVGIARRSSHPQALGFAVGAFLMAVHVQEMMRRMVPDIASLPYPGRADLDPPAIGQPPASGGHCGHGEHDAHGPTDHASSDEHPRQPGELQAPPPSPAIE